jgi:hypothetical protein
MARLKHKGTRMGKAADNEAIKLRATFYNNLAVGAALAGVIVPIVTFYQTHNSIAEFVSQNSFLQLYRFALPFVLGIGTAGIARTWADSTIQKLLD